MGQYGLGTRLAMIFMGAVWSAAGGAWLYHLGPTYLSRQDEDDPGVALPIALLCGGLVLLWSGATPNRPKTFEDEIPDANPDLGNDD